MLAEVARLMRADRSLLFSLARSPEHERLWVGHQALRRRLLAQRLRGHLWFQHTLVALCAIAVGFSYGLSYGLETHTTYLLHPLRALEPEFLRFDWLAAETAQYHKRFSSIIYALSLLVPLPWAVAIGNVALVAAFILAIYAFSFAYFRRDAFLVSMLLMFLLVLERTASIADSHILTSRLEPSSVAACAAAIALLLISNREFLVFQVQGGLHAKRLARAGDLQKSSFAHREEQGEMEARKKR